MGFARTPAALIAARAAQGIGAALAAPGMLALVTTSARDDAAPNRVLALFSAVTIGGGTFGLLLGGLVTEVGSWCWPLFINVPIGVAARLVTETPRSPGRFDLIGAPDHGWASAQTTGIGELLRAPSRPG
ncbi:MFS transporter [Streptomyces afghaniensis]|uniref:MFS transporter n=1 Tax=Streptomyces afghaniensis TaxID=66865 RepID=UPI00278237C5|nr:MFS transporter [Streptomyces afghaniensis]MDQ1013679.1 MFS family permease [Streptomyces afghaniensis]